MRDQSVKLLKSQNIALQKACQEWKKCVFFSLISEAKTELNAFVVCSSCEKRRFASICKNIKKPADAGHVHRDTYGKVTSIFSVILSSVACDKRLCDQTSVLLFVHSRCRRQTVVAVLKKYFFDYTGGGFWPAI
jgi:hypothetical protein